VLVHLSGQALKDSFSKRNVSCRSQGASRQQKRINQAFKTIDLSVSLSKFVVNQK
jgi:hypothetical protein